MDHNEIKDQILQKIHNFLEPQLRKTKLVGILNVTPDSFSDGGMFLDKDSAEKHFMQMFEELNKEGITIILVTHSAEVAGYAKRTIQIKDGIIIGGIFGKNDAEEGAQKP